MDVVADTLAIADHNRAMRFEVLRLCDLLAKLPMWSLPQSTEHFFTEWTAKRGESLLGVSLTILQCAEAIEKLASFRLVMPGYEEHSSVSLEVEDNNWSTKEIESLASLGKVLLQMPVVIWLRGFVQGVASVALGVFGQSCEMAGVQVIAANASFVGQSIPQVVKLFVDCDKMPESVKAANAFLSDGPITLPSGAAFAMVSDVLKLSPVTKLDLDSSLAKEPATGLPRDEVAAMIDLVHLLHFAGCSMLFLGAALPEPSHAISQDTVRSDILRAIDFGETACQDAVNSIQASLNLLNSASDFPVQWRMPLPHLKCWFGMCKLFMKDLRTRILDAMICHVHQMALKVEKHTPKFDHFVSETEFIRALVKRHLLENKLVAGLGPEVLALFQASKRCTEIAESFGLPDPKESEPHKESIQHIGIVYSEAKKTMQVVAGCKIVMTMSGKGQQSEAFKLLQRSSLAIPKALRTHLEKLAKTQGAGAKRGAAEAGLVNEGEDQ